MNKTIILTVLLVVVFAGASFFGGMKYQQSKLPSFNRQFGGMQGRNGQGQASGNRQNFRPVNGDIISSDDKSITVKLQDGSTKIVLFTNQTSINKASQATATDLKTGEKVAVFGQQNSDGSVTATSIQLNPIEIQRGATPSITTPTP